MKAVLISINPKWVDKIASGEKTIEVRKSVPKLERPFKCYIYATKPKKWFRFSSWGYASDESLWLLNGKVKMCDGFEFWAGDKEYEPLCGKVIGEFVCDRIDEIYQCNSGWVKENACISKEEFFDYLGIPRGTHFGYDKKAYAWHITDLKIYDKPKELSEFYLQCEEYGKTGTVDIPKKCKKCRYQYTWNLASKCRIDGLKPITKPPQSWCYVEV